MKHFHIGDLLHANIWSVKEAVTWKESAYNISYIDGIGCTSLGWQISNNRLCAGILCNAGKQMTRLSNLTTPRQQYVANSG